MRKTQTKTRASEIAKTATHALVVTERKLVNITPEQRKHMIAEAAYYRAEQRDFQPGDPQQDWLEADAQIDQMLVGTRH